jgi:hypothetical protein
MPRLPPKQLSRKVTRKDLAEAARAQAELAPPSVGPLIQEFDPELHRIKQTYSVPEVIEMIHQAEKKPKHQAGRPATFDRNKILDAAARAKAAGRPYTALAASFHLEPKQLTNLVERNRRYFDRKVREFRATTRNSAIKE